MINLNKEDRLAFIESIKNDNVKLAFIESIKNDNVKDFCFFVHSNFFYFDTNENYFIRTASRLGKYNIVKFLSQQPEVDITAYNNSVLRGSITSKNIKLINFILDNENVDPSDFDNEAICLATKLNLSSILERLLNDDRVDPNVSNSLPIQLALINKEYDILSLLIKSDKVFLFDVDNYYIFNVISANKFNDLFHICLKKINPSDIFFDKIIAGIIASNNSELLSFILSNYKIPQTKIKKALFNYIHISEKEVNVLLLNKLKEINKKDINELTFSTIFYHKNNFLKYLVDNYKKYINFNDKLLKQAILKYNLNALKIIINSNKLDLNKKYNLNLKILNREEDGNKIIEYIFNTELKESIKTFDKDIYNELMNKYISKNINQF